MTPTPFPIPGLEAPAPEPVVPDEGVTDSLARVLQGPGYDPAELERFAQDVDTTEALLSDDTLPPHPELEKSDDDLVASFEHRLRQASEFREPFEKRWLKAWYDYNQRLVSDDDRWNSKLFLPYLYAVVTTAIPAAVAAAFDSGSIATVGPQERSDEKKAKAAETVLEWYVKTKMQARRSIRDFLWHAYLFGTGAVRVEWKYEMRERLVPVPVYAPGPPDPVTGQPTQGEFLGTRRALKNVVTADHPCIVPVNIWNIFLCPWTTKGDERIPYAIEYVESTREDALNAARAGYFGEEGVERLEAHFAEDPPEGGYSDAGLYSHIGSRAEAMRELGFGDPYGGESTPENADKSYAPFNYFMLTTRDYTLFVTADGSRNLVGKKRNEDLVDDLPYVLFHYDRIPGLPYGKGIGEISGPIQSQLNFDINHANDSRRLRLNQPLKVRRFGNSLVEGDTGMKPGKMIRVMDPTDVEPLVIPDTTQGVLEWQSMLIGFGDKAVGINEIARGYAQPGANTATEASLLDSQIALRRTEHGNEWMEAMRGILKRVMALIQQYTTQDLAIRIAGPAGFEWQTVTPEDILGEFDIVPTVSFLKSNPALHRQDWLGLFPLLSGHPLVNQHELVKRTLDVFRVEHPEMLLVEPPAPPADPMLEEIALKYGINPPVSMDEDFPSHIQTHALHLQALLAAPVKDARAIKAHEDHLRDTMSKQAEVAMLMSAGAQTSAGGGAEGGKTGTGSPVRDGATRLGQGQGSDGPPGRSPGPANPPGRPRAR